MSVSAKICGLTDEAAMEAAVESGARFVGLVFFPPSPRSLAPARAAALAAQVPSHVGKVGVFVDPDDALLDEVFRAVGLDFVQLHGAESPERAEAIRVRTGAGIIKAIKVAEASDVALAEAYGNVADWILFDAKAPKGASRPGGNALPFDWSILRDERAAAAGLPWLLSGGLDIDNVAQAVKITGARAVDVSSGVEAAPGRKDPALVRAFLEAVARL